MVVTMRDSKNVTKLYLLLNCLLLNRRQTLVQQLLLCGKLNFFEKRLTYIYIFVPFLNFNPPNIPAKQQ